MTIAWHIDVSSIVCTLIRNSKLANQIATLLPIVVKKKKITLDIILTAT